MVKPQFKYIVKAAIFTCDFLYKIRKTLIRLLGLEKRWIKLR